MATNVKKFKYSIWFKLICFLLSLVFFVGAIGTSLYLYEIYSYTDMELKDYYSSRRVGDVISDRIQENIYEVTYTSRRAELDSIIEAEREKAVNTVYDWYMSDFDSINESFSNGEDLGNYEENTYHYTVNDDKLTQRSYDFSVSAFNCYTETEYATEDMTPNEYINDCYSEFKSQCLQEAFGDEDLYFGNYKDLSTECYARYSGAEQLGQGTISVDGVNPLKMNNKGLAQWLKTDHYVIIWDGKLIVSDDIKGSARTVIESGINKILAEYEGLRLVFCIDDNILSSQGKSFISNLSSSNAQLSSLYFLHTFGNKYGDLSQNSSERLISLVVLFAVCSLVAGIVFISLAGKKKNGQVKIYFIDKIPFIFHIIISCALGVFATAGLSEIFNSCFVYSAAYILSVALLFICYFVLLLELVASLVRCKRGERLKKDYLLSVMIFKQLRKFFKFLGKKLKKLVKTLSYVPNKFKRNIIIISALYFVGTVICVNAAILFGFELYPISILIVLCWLVGSSVGLYYVCDYIKNFDLVINGFYNNEPMQSSRYTSLQYLIDSYNDNQRQLQEAVAKAVKDERLRSELITNVSHDLKTPLTSIINYVDLLKSCDIQDEKALEYINVLDDKSERLKRLIEDLMEASKVTSGNIIINPTALNLYELCVQATGEVNEDFEKAGLNLIVKECEKSPVIFADGAKTFRIIENLLSNARKYSAVGSRVYVSVGEEKGIGIFEIKNISAQPLDVDPQELTERFVRGDKSRNQEGNGLGLSIAKELCKAQGGYLDIIIDGDLFKAKVKLPLAK